MTNEQIKQIIQEELDKPENKDKSWVLENCVFLAVGGSRLYGINNEDSDYDIIGVTIAPGKYWIGLPKFEQIEIKRKDIGIEGVIYDIRKALWLIYNNNPNLLEIMFVDNPIIEDDLWKSIKSNVDKFLNQRTYVAFKGYSNSQISKAFIKQNNKSGRQDLIEKYGMDVKFLSHVFRLARQGQELLLTGKIQFPRPDAKELKAIRNGKFDSLEEAKIEAEKELKKLDEAFEKTVLPKKGDYEFLNDLYMKIFWQYVYIDTIKDGT